MLTRNTLQNSIQKCFLHSFLFFLFKHTHLQMLFIVRPLVTMYFYCRQFLQDIKCRIIQHMLSIKFFNYLINKGQSLTFGLTIFIQNYKCYCVSTCIKCFICFSKILTYSIIIIIIIIRIRQLQQSEYLFLLQLYLIFMQFSST